MFQGTFPIDYDPYLCSDATAILCSSSSVNTRRHPNKHHANGLVFTLTNNLHITLLHTNHYFL